MHPIKRYYNALADGLSAAADRAGSVEHRGDIGHNREKPLCEFLNKHLPNRLQAFLGGKALGLDQEPSKQIDIFVKNDLSPKFEEDEKRFVFCETLAAAISVKSTLSKAELIDSLQNLASIPQHSMEALSFLTLKPEGREQFANLYPNLIVFAYGGIKGETCVKYINNFYASNPEIPLNRRVNTIAVNRSYTIKFSTKKLKTFDGTIISPETYHLSNLPESYRGFPLIGIVNDISSHTSWLPYLDFNLHSYANRAYHEDA